MAVLSNKIRLGAVSSLLFGSVDLGATSGGVELNYNATSFQVEIDQSILPVQVYKTKEEVTLGGVLVQYQMSLLAAAFALITSGVSISGVPGATIITTSGGTSAGRTVADGVTTINTPNISSATIAFTSADIGRTVSGAGIPTVPTPIILSITSGTAAVMTGNATASATGVSITLGSVVTPSYDTMTFGGDPSVPQATLDWIVPKNDGTTNRLLGHFNRCASWKPIKLNYQRDKNTELNRIEFLSLADASQPVGRQCGYLIEEYPAA